MFSFFSFSLFYNREKSFPPSWPLFLSGPFCLSMYFTLSNFLFLSYIIRFSLSSVFFPYINVIQYFHKKKKQTGKDDSNSVNGLGKKLAIE